MFLALEFSSEAFPTIYNPSLASIVCAAVVPKERPAAASVIVVVDPMVSTKKFSPVLAFFTTSPTVKM